VVPVYMDAGCTDLHAPQCVTLYAHLQSSLYSALKTFYSLYEFYLRTCQRYWFQVHHTFFSSQFIQPIPSSTYTARRIFWNDPSACQSKAQG
jgi:hypothetical protein